MRYTRPITVGTSSAVDKGKVHHWWRILRRVKVWHLVVLFVIAFAASLVLLRQNNLGMVERRNLVKQADEQAKDIQKALDELQRYVTTHMNTAMGEKGIYLEHSYQRAYDQAVQEGLRDDSASRSLYENADAQCQAVFNRTSSFPEYTQCVAEKLASHQGSDPLANARVPSVDVYRYNFVSPAWSPDAAGFAVLVTALLGLLILGRIILYWTLYFILKRNHH